MAGKPFGLIARRHDKTTIQGSGLQFRWPVHKGVVAIILMISPRYHA